MSARKVSVIIPVLLASKELIDMTAICLSTMGNVGQVIVIGNDSYAINVNNGLKAATGDYLIICNNDIEFIQPDWIEHLLKPLDEGYAISSIRTSDADGYTVKDRYEENAKFGSIWAMRRETYEMLGELDETFGNYFEDLDYHQRALKANMKVVKNHNGLVDHKAKATFKIVDPNDRYYKQAKEKFKNKWGKVW